MSKELSVEESSEIPGNYFLDVAGKFKLFRMNAESAEKKLKDANTVIERLKEEITSIKDSERNIKNQLSSSQNRLISLQQTITKFITVSEEQMQSEKKSQQIEQTIEKINEEIVQIRTKSQEFLQTISNEMNLAMEINNLKSILATKDRENDLMKMEIKSLTLAKRNLEIENQQKLKDLETNLEKLKRKEIDSEKNYNETLIYYQQQLEEKENKIKAYEKERNNFLDDFESLKDPEKGPENFPMADSTVCINPPDRALTNENNNIESEMDEEEEFTQIFHCLPSGGKSHVFNLTKRKLGENNFKSGKKQKPQLEFLTTSRHFSRAANCRRNEQKRRLFSTNCNHYTEQ